MACRISISCIKKKNDMPQKINEEENTPQSCSLYELTTQVRRTLEDSFADAYWVRAETSDVRVNAASGHCYLEFVEKSPETNQLIAKARGSIWARTFRLLKPYFELETGQAFTSGLKVLVKVTVEFHELYGFSLNVLDIDPSYTLGDMMRRRQEIIRRLQDEGVFDLNRELVLPELTRRLAVITSPTAAGYEDFTNQLLNNPQGYPFYIKLFPALMQGEKTEESVIAALDRIYEHRDLFDAVIIIRGGGATSDLNSFDSYLLAANCAQFPLPILTGIGHERDDTIVDLVAHTRLKTPTAVAAFLLERMDRVAGELSLLQQQLVQDAERILLAQRNFLQLLSTRFPERVLNRIERSRSELHRLAAALPSAVSTLLAWQDKGLEQMKGRIRSAVENRCSRERQFVLLTEQFIRMASPDYVLKRGYSLALKDGRIVKSPAGLAPGDSLTVRWADGEAQTEIKKLNISSENG